jgi:3-oxoacyl-[acyl-carrier protein] reductase
MPSVLITGGTRGIGLALVQAFADHQWKIATCFHEDENAAQITQQILQSRTIHPFIIKKCDVNQPKQIQQFVHETVHQWGTLDCVIHNAGSTKNARLLNLDEWEFSAMVQIHLTAAFMLAQASLKPMLHQETGGHIIFISSVVATTGNIGQSAYAAAKAGMIGLARSLAQEYGSRRIRANVVCPGFHLTKIAEDLSPEAIQKIRQKHLLPETTSLDELSRFLVLLAESRTVSGQIFNWDSRPQGWI